MARYVLNRIFWLIIVVVATAFLIFTLLYVTPGDPGSLILGSSGSAADVQALNEKLGVTEPYLVQLGKYLYNTFIKFDFGVSWTYQTPVFDQIFERLPRTVIMNLLGMVFCMAGGLILGIIAGTHANKPADTVIMAVSMFLHCAPSFWVALMMIVVFAGKLKILPAYGLDDGWKSFVMPVLSGALGGLAGNARQTRSSILEVYRADYIVTARAKGQTERNVILHHMLPNALMPIITSIGAGLAMLVSGSVITESIFSIPGLGLYLLSAMNSRDYPVIRACVVFFAAFAAVVMLLTDLAYAYINPQIKAQYAKGGK